MFTKLDKTKYLPGEKPVLAWDGNCGFCHYWVLRWKTFTGDNVIYRPYSEVAPDFPDIDLKYFKQAVRFVDVDGKIYAGPGAAFQAFQYGDRYKWLMPLYKNFKPAEWFADNTYRLISKNRPFMYKVTVALWGRNPRKQKKYWLVYAGALVVATGMAMLVHRK